MFVLGMGPDGGLLPALKSLVACYYLAAPLGWKRPSAIWGSAYRKVPLFATLCCLGILLAEQILQAPYMVSTSLNVLLVMFGLIALIIVATTKPLICGYIFAISLLSSFILAIVTAYQHYQLALALAGVNLFHAWMIWRAEKAFRKQAK